MEPESVHEDGTEEGLSMRCILWKSQRRDQKIYPSAYQCDGSLDNQSPGPRYSAKREIRGLLRWKMGDFVVRLAIRECQLASLMEVYMIYHPRADQRRCAAI